MQKNDSVYHGSFEEHEALDRGMAHDAMIKKALPEIFQARGADPKAMGEFQCIMEEQKLSERHMNRTLSFLAHLVGDHEKNREAQRKVLEAWQNFTPKQREEFFNIKVLDDDTWQKTMSKKLYSLISSALEEGPM